MDMLSRRLAERLFRLQEEARSRGLRQCCHRAGEAEMDPGRHRTRSWVPGAQTRRGSQGSRHHRGGAVTLSQRQLEAMWRFFKACANDMRGSMQYAAREYCEAAVAPQVAVESEETPAPRKEPEEDCRHCVDSPNLCTTGAYGPCRYCGENVFFKFAGQREASAPATPVEAILEDRARGEGGGRIMVPGTVPLARPASPSPLQGGDAK